MSSLPRFGLTAIVAAATGVALASCAVESPPDSPESGPSQTTAADTDTKGGADSARLLVSEDDADGWPDVRLAGMLGVNDFGCVTLGDQLLIAPAGSTVAGTIAADDVTVKIVGYPELSIGDGLDGGGYPDERTIGDIQEFVPDIAQCVPSDAGKFSVAIFAPGAVLSPG